MNKKIFILLTLCIVSQNIYAKKDLTAPENQISDKSQTLAEQLTDYMGIDDKHSISHLALLINKYPKTVSAFVGGMTMHLAHRNKLPLKSNDLLTNAADTLTSITTFIPNFIIGLGANSLQTLNNTLTCVTNNPGKTFIGATLTALTMHHFAIKVEEHKHKKRKK